jgi:hypothetical protein
MLSRFYRIEVEHDYSGVQKKVAAALLKKCRSVERETSPENHLLKEGPCP